MKEKKQLYVDIFGCQLNHKLDGVGPVDNRPSTHELHHFVQKKKIKKINDVTRDMWHMTRDTWHVWGGWTFSQIFSSLALTVCDLWYYEDQEEKDDSLNYKALYRTAQATPGLLKNSVQIKKKLNIFPSPSKDQLQKGVWLDFKTNSKVKKKKSDFLSSGHLKKKTVWKIKVSFSIVKLVCSSDLVPDIPGLLYGVCLFVYWHGIVCYTWHS